MKRISPTLAGLVLFSLAFSAQEAKITTENGVLVVRNPKNPSKSIAKSLTLAEDLVIGASGREADSFSMLQAIVVDDDGKIYALDNKVINVRVFDKDGRFLRAFGRKGQGPGEWGLPARMILAPDQTLMIYDAGNSKVGRFSFDGECLREISLAKLAFVSRILPEPGGGYYAELTEYDREAGQRALKVIQLDGAMNSVRQIAEAKSEYNLKTVDPNPGRFNLHILRDGALVWTHTGRYEIHWVNPEGKPVRTSFKEYDPLAIDAEEKARIIKDAFGERGLPNGVVPVIPKAYPPIFSMIADDTGRIFVRTYERDAQGRTKIDIFDPEGRHFSSIYHSPDEFLFVVKKNRMYFLVTENEDGIPVVKRYAMIWK